MLAPLLVDPALQRARLQRLMIGAVKLTKLVNLRHHEYERLLSLVPVGNGITQLSHFDIGDDIVVVFQHTEGQPAEFSAATHKLRRLS